MEFWILLLIVWAIYRTFAGAIRRRKDDERFERVVNALNQMEARLKDLKKLETRIDKLEKGQAEAGQSEKAQPHMPPVEPAPLPTAAPLPAAPPPPPVPAKPLVIEVPPAPPASKPTPPPPTPQHPVPPPHPIPAAPQTHPPSAPAPTTPRPSVAPPVFAGVRRQEPPTPSRGFDLEQTLGGNWLSKVGIVLLVIGISWFLSTHFQKLNNPEKVAVGYAIGAAILGAGIYLERRDLYRIFARALLGGGWALIFFVTYAMHFVPYTRVIDTQWVDLVLMFFVAAAMVVHTLRYDSQVVTGLAFLLAFTTVALSQNTIYSLSAGAILAVGLVAIVHRRQWFELELFGILASYVNHFLWLAQVIVPVHGHHRMFPEFVPSTVLLCLYWAIYRWSYIARRVQDARQETISSLAAILNTSLLLLIFKYQSVRPELAFYALLALGAAELTLGQLPVTRRRRIAFVLLSSIGTVLMVAAIPFKFTGMDIAIIWLAESQILLLAGVFNREILFRRFGLLAAVLTALDMLASQALPALFEHLSQPIAGFHNRFTGLPLPPDAQLALSFLVAAIFFYANSLLLPRRWKDVIESDSEQGLFRGLSYLAALMLAVSVWLALTEPWTAVAWAGAALLLIVLGRAVQSDDLANQAHLLAAAAFLRALALNYGAAGLLGHSGFTVRLISVASIAALFYLCACWADDSASESQPVRASEMYTTGSALLLALLIFFEAGPAWMGVVWGLFALALGLYGYFRERREMSLQAHVIVLAGFARTLLFDLGETRELHGFTVRFLTFTSTAALLYLCAYFAGPRGTDVARLFSSLETWAGSILIAALAFLEVSSPWIAVAWATFAFLLLVIGNRVKSAQLHFQAYLLSICCVVQIFAVNLYAAQPFRFWPGVSVRLVTMSLVAALFYLSARFAADAEHALAAFAGLAYSWAGSALVVALILEEMSARFVVLGWGVFGLLLFELGVLRKSRNWRAQGYITLACAFVRVILFNINSPSASLDVLVTTLPLALIFYFVYTRLTLLSDVKLSPDPFYDERRYLVAPILAYLGSITLFLTANTYYRAGPLLVAWAALAMAFIAVAWFADRAVFLQHSLIAAVLLFLRALALEFPFAGRTYSAGGLSNAFYISFAAALLFACQAFAFPLRKRFAERGSIGPSAEQPSWIELLRRPEQVYFFLPFLLVTLLIWNEVSSRRVTIGWGIEALLIFLYALLVGERSFRLTGVALLCGCVAKIILLDVWRQERSDQIVIFVTLGPALILVSFLYTRYRDAIRRYL